MNTILAQTQMCLFICLLVVFSIKSIKCQEAWTWTASINTISLGLSKSVGVFEGKTQGLCTSNKFWCKPEPETLPWHINECLWTQHWMPLNTAPRVGLREMAGQWGTLADLPGVKASIPNAQKAAYNSNSSSRGFDAPGTCTGIDGVRTIIENTFDY